MGIRLFFLMLALLLVYLIVRHFLRQSSAQRPIAKKGVDMVQCVHCGVHLPKPEAIFDEPNFYCSEEHRRLG
ncbi:MAG: hypothetical protein L3J28_04080 [Candidatus Polarisedimenticolaceae bacterium]|nr:hypothetical protein [Candidatus Polarisedimenticolaceae bacterium]